VTRAQHVDRIVEKLRTAGADASDIAFMEHLKATAYSLGELRGAFNAGTQKATDAQPQVGVNWAWLLEGLKLALNAARLNIRRRMVVLDPIDRIVIAEVDVQVGLIDEMLRRLAARSDGAID
jgi:hypothetical protein